MNKPNYPYGGGRVVKKGDNFDDSTKLLTPDTEQLCDLLGLDPDAYTLAAYFPVFQSSTNDQLQTYFFSERALIIFNHCVHVFHLPLPFSPEKKQQSIKTYLSSLTHETTEELQLMINKIIDAKYVDTHVLVGVVYQDYFKLYETAEFLKKYLLEGELLKDGTGKVKKRKPRVKPQNDIPPYTIPEDFFVDFNRNKGDVYHFVTRPKQRSILLHATSDQINELLTYIRSKPEKDKQQNLSKTLDLLTELFTEKEAEEKNPGGVLQ